MPSPLDAFDIFQVPIPASEEHLTKWIQTRLLSFQSDPSSFLSVYEDAVKLTREAQARLLNNHNIHNFVASKNGAWAAIASVAVINDETRDWASVAAQDKEKLGFLLLYIWVHPDYRRSGLASRVLEAAMNWVKDFKSEGQAKYTMLEVFEDNNAVKFYERVGYTTKFVQEYGKTGRRVLSMVRDAE